MSNIVIKVAQSEVKQDKNGRNYKTVTFGEVKFIDTPFGKQLVPATQAKTTLENPTYVCQHKAIRQKG